MEAAKLDNQWYDSATPQQLTRSVLDDDVTLIDARAAAEWQAGHLPNVRHIMLGVLSQHTHDIINGKPVVLHCFSEVRSAIAASIVRIAGAKNAINMLGGYRDWVAAACRPRCDKKVSLRCAWEPCLVAAPEAMMCRTTFLRRERREMSIRRTVGLAQLLSAASSGVIIAVSDIIIVISFATLVFSGALVPFVSDGIGFFLFGALMLGLVTALGSSFSHAIAFPQDTSTVLLGLMAVALASRLSDAAEPATLFYTVVAAMVLASLLTGAMFLLLGTLNLGNLVRYVPYPVVGGFLAGTGWLLVDGAISVMTDTGITLATLPALFESELLLRWLPGFALAVLILLALRRYSHPLILPGLLLGAILLFHVMLFLANVPTEVARAGGWLLGPFPEGGLWRPITPTALQRADWGAILTQSGTIGTILLIALLSFLLNASGLELALQQNIDLNRELRITGLANMLSGLGGGPVGYHVLSLSALSYKMTPSGRTTGIIISLANGLALLVGASFLAFFPTFLLGGLLLFLGLDFLVSWLVDTWNRMARSEYAIVALIALAMAVVGVLQGVAFGLFLAMVLFVVEYGRSSPIRRAFSGETYRSTVDRPPTQRRMLQQQGHQIFILELQRFIFFGTASKLFDAVRQRVTETAPPRFILLDFKRVSGLDSSAVSSFTKMLQLAQSRAFTLLFAGLTPAMERQLAPVLDVAQAQDDPRIFPDLDHAVEWCEEQLLIEQQADPAGTTQTLADAAAEFGALAAYMEEQTVVAGEYLIRQGERSQGLYFLHAGRLTARLEYPDGRVVRLRTMQPGVFIGELSLYAGAPASASVLADCPSTVLYLSAAALARLEQDAPAVAATFHKRMAQLSSERLLDATQTMAVLMQ